MGRPPLTPISFPPSLIVVIYYSLTRNEENTFKLLSPLIQPLKSETCSQQIFCVLHFFRLSRNVFPSFSVEFFHHFLSPLSFSGDYYTYTYTFFHATTFYKTQKYVQWGFILSIYTVYYTAYILFNSLNRILVQKSRLSFSLPRVRITLRIKGSFFSFTL